MPEPLKNFFVDSKEGGVFVCFFLRLKEHESRLKPLLTDWFEREIDFFFKLVESELKLEPFKLGNFDWEEGGFFFFFFGGLEGPIPLKSGLFDCNKRGFSNGFFCEFWIPESRPESFKQRSVDVEEERVSFFLAFLELELNR